MSETPKPDDSKAETGDLRSQLVKRLAVAGALVAILLGILAVFDRLVTNPEESDAPVFSKPVPVQPKKMLTQPVTPAPAPPAEPEVQAVPPSPQPPPPPQIEEPVATQPVDEKPKISPDAHPVNNAPVPKAAANRPAKVITPTEKAVPPVIAEATAPPVIAPEAAVSSPAPVVSTAPAARASEPTASPVRRLFSGFVVQAGVFSSAQRAEELQAQLQLGGVPATLETRVQVGPFKTRQEAEAAQEKLRKMGIESLLVPPKGARN